MADPRRPKLNRPGPVDPVIGPGPVRPIPWTPFGRGDNSTLDAAAIVKRAARTRASLRKAQLELTGMRDGPGPDNTPPRVVEVSRADGLWPYLLIRHEPGDTGARPLDAGTRATMGDGEHWSPDILLTDADALGATTIIDRGGFPTFKPWVVYGVTWGLRYDIWVHVWNLGQAQATGVRLRAFLSEVGLFLGGRQVDLGDRLSATSHRIVKVATYMAGSSGEGTWTPVTVVAECLSDVASGDRSPGMDRHCAQSWLTAN